MSRKKQHKSKILKKKSRLSIGFLYRIARRFGLFIGGAGIIAWAFAWAWFGGVFSNGFNWVESKSIVASYDAGFKVDNLFIEGRVNINPELLLEVMGVKNGQPLFKSDIDDIQLRIEALEWAESAVIQRRAPNDIYVYIEERSPIALLKNSNKTLSLLDSKGRVIQVPIKEKFRGFIIASGQGVEDQVYHLVEQLNNYNSLKEHIDVVEWVSSRRWDFITKDGVRIKMPEENLDYALGKLNELQDRSEILLKPLKVIDLRQDGRIIAWPRDGESFNYDHVVPVSSNGVAL